MPLRERNSSHGQAILELGPKRIDAECRMFVKLASPLILRPNFARGS